MTLSELRALPKVELHCHLEGALHLPTLWKFSQKHEPGRYQAFEQFKAACTIAPGTAPGFKAFLGKFEPLRFHYGNLQDLTQLAYDSVHQFALDAYYREIRFSPVFFARRLLKGAAAEAANVPQTLVEDAAAAIIEGCHDASHMVGGFCSTYMLTCSRHFGYQVNAPALNLLHSPIGVKFRGLDLAGDEAVDASAFVADFREWKDAGKLITIHAGEDPNAGGPRNIVEALELFKADRIGHGVRAIEDPMLMSRLANEGIPLEICPTSNQQTLAVPQGTVHPLKALFDAGIRVTLSTDDPVICGTTMGREYALAGELGMSAEDLFQCSQNALDASMLNTAEKAEFGNLREMWKGQTNLNEHGMN